MSYNEVFPSVLFLFSDNGTTDYEKLALLQHSAIKYCLLAQVNGVLINPESLSCNGGA